MTKITGNNTSHLLDAHGFNGINLLNLHSDIFISDNNILSQLTISQRILVL